MALDLKKIEQMATVGATTREMADVLGIDEITLRRRCEKLIRQSIAKGKVLLRTWQMKSAQEGDTGAQVWLGKNRLGQTDKQEVTHTGDPIKFTFDLGHKLNAEQENQNGQVGRNGARLHSPPALP